MAVWQYTFYFVSDRLISDRDRKTMLINEEDLTNRDFWKGLFFDRSLFLNVKEIMKKNISWSDYIDLYGNQSSNNIEIHYDAKTQNITDATLRIDFRTDYEIVLRNVIDFCIINKLKILDEECNLVDLNFITINEIIDRSPQKKKYRDLSDPFK